MEEVASAVPDAQGLSGAQARPETKPVVSTNLAIVDNEGDGFWMAEAADPLMDHNPMNETIDPDNEERKKPLARSLRARSLLDDEDVWLVEAELELPWRSQDRRCRGGQCGPRAATDSGLDAGLLPTTRAFRGRAPCHAHDPSRSF
jgi:hypothetical protein